MRPPRVVGVVLAAGEATRFGGAKVLAPLAGRPLLEHVLDAAVEAGLADVVVVLGESAADVERVVRWRGERRVVNPEPSSGLSSSLRIGLAAVGSDADAALVLLGDQPLVRAAVIRALVDRASVSDRPIVVPRYADGSGPNPALVRRSAWGLADAATGDRGLGPTIAAHPELVEEVPLAGGNPDVDTRSDLAALEGPVAEASWTGADRSSRTHGGVTRPGRLVLKADAGARTLGARRPAAATEVHSKVSDALLPTAGEAIAAWGARVRANAEQVERVREVPDPPDFYGPTSALFRADPRRRDEPLLDDLLALARPDETWLDIGAGAGRYALPLALAVREVIAVEPSPGMAGALREGMTELGIANVRIVEGGWPPSDPTTGAPIVSPPTADVALIAHLGYDIERLGPFLDAMEASAGRLCAAILMERQPSSIADPFWPIVHGEERVPLPALGEFLVVLRALDRPFEVRLHERPPRAFESEEAVVSFLRRQLWVAEGGAKDRRFVAAVRERLVEQEGGFTLADQRTLPVGLVTWRPGRPA